MRTVAALWRYPVKSMLGEQLESVEVTERGLVGDRGYAVIDVETGKVASAKHPGKWSVLLQLRARYTDEPAAGAPVPAVVITFADGTERTSDDTDIDDVLSTLVGRRVHLAAQPPPGSVYEEVWPNDVDGMAPDEFIDATTVATTPEGERISDITISMAAPPGTFFDLSTLHVVTASTLATLQTDVRRFRPNAVVDDTDDGRPFSENDWVGRTLAFGADARARVDLPTMRCVMTTLAQPGLEQDRSVLQNLTRMNRIEISGLGVWACAGAYATVTGTGRVAVGDRFDVDG